MYIREIKDKFIHVFDSRGCSVKQTLIYLKIMKLIALKMDETKMVESVNEYMSNMKFFFNLDYLIL